MKTVEFTSYLDVQRFEPVDIQSVFLLAEILTAQYILFN